MSLGQAKVYFDGSHYIAIPHTTRNVKKRPPKVEETITVVENTNEENEIAYDENITQENQNEVVEEITLNKETKDKIVNFLI